MVICYLCPYENNDDDDCDKNVSWFTQLMRMIVMKTKIKEGVKIPVLINKKCSFIICKSSFSLLLEICKLSNFDPERSGAVLTIAVVKYWFMGCAGEAGDMRPAGLREQFLVLVTRIDYNLSNMRIFIST